jgi:hypothetical protein
MTGAMDQTPDRRSPDLLDEAGPELAALLQATADDLRRGPDELTRARHLRAMRAARCVPARAEPFSPIRPVRRIVASVAVAALAAGVALASVGALPGPVQEVASSVAARVGLDLPTPADRRAPGRSDTADDAGDVAGQEGARPGRSDEAARPDGPPGRDGSAPGLADREAPPGSIAQRRPGFDGPPLDAWNRMPEWLQQRRDATGPPSERPAPPDARPDPPVQVPTPRDGPPEGTPQAPSTPGGGAPDTPAAPGSPADPPTDTPAGSDPGGPPATGAAPPAAGGGAPPAGPDDTPAAGEADTSPPDRPVTERSQSDTESAERAQPDDRPSP